MIIEGIMKGLAIWVYNLLLEIVEFIADALLDVFNMDLAYFESNVPVTGEIVTVIMGAGWALLIGNLTFQAIKSMASGIGFEGEDPKMLFTRTFVFSFLLLASRQICTIGLNMTSTLNTLMQTPSAVNLGLPELDIFSFSGSWLLVIIIGVVLMFQLIRFFFEMAERYVVLVILTLFSPLAFGVGGSKNTEDIFRGWARMYGSACLMMVFNTVFLKLLLSAMSNMPGGTGSTVALLPWTLLVVGIAKVARRIDDIVARIGLNTARTGDKLGAGGLMYPIMIMRNLSGIVGKTIGGAAKTASRAPNSGTRGGGVPKSPASPPSPGPTPSGNGNSANSPTGSGGTAVPPPPPGPSPGNATSSGMDNNAPPARPPVGVRGDISGRGRSAAQTPIEQESNIGGGGVSRGGGAGRSSTNGLRGNREDETRFAGNGNSKPNTQSSGGGGVSRGGGAGRSSTNGLRGNREDETRFGVNGNSKPNTQSSGGGGRTNLEQNDVRTQPTLSTDTRTPGATVPQKSVFGGNTNKIGGQFGRKVNIDVYRDDDPPIRPSQTRYPASGGTHPSAVPGGTSKQATQTAAVPLTGTITAGMKSSKMNTQTEGAAKKGMSGIGQAGSVPSGMSSAPVNAASPRGGRVSGGATNPSDSHRAPSKSISSRIESATARTDASQIQSAHNLSKSVEPRRTPSSTPISASAQTSNPTRYRLVSRSIREASSRGSYNSDSRRTPEQARHSSAEHPANERDSRGDRTSSGNRGTPPPSAGRFPGPNQPKRR